MMETKAYKCATCNAEIRFHNILAMSTTRVIYDCACTPTPISAGYKSDLAAMLRLFGELRPRLPYTASETPVIPQPYVDRELAKLALILLTVDSAEDFEQRCGDASGS